MKKKLIEKLELKHDLRLTWRETLKKIKNESVQEIVVFGLFEFIPGKERGNFMDEIYRILMPEGKALFSVAYWNTAQAVQDYLYEFPTICEQSFLYFNKAWCETNNLGNRGLKCDFDFTYGYTPTPEIQIKSEETRSFSLRHYNNTVQNLQLCLTKRPLST